MARNDIYYQNVKEALIAAGWTIKHDPFRVALPSSKFKLKMDFGVERQILEIENHKEKIVVEVKSFLDTSFMNDFHDARGQYSDYVGALEYAGIKRKLFLAVPDDVYEKHFMDPYIIYLVVSCNMSIITFDTKINRIIKWLPR